MPNLALVKDKYGYRLTHLEHRHHATHSKKWHALRRSFIGGSDSAALANNFAHARGIPSFTLYATPLTLFRAKQAAVPKSVASEAIARGLRRESGLRAIAARTIYKELGIKVKVRRQAYTYLTTVAGIHLGANLDGIVMESDGSLAGLEIKTGNHWVGRDWQHDGLPANYYCQVQHYMLVTGLRKFYLLAEIGDSLLLRVIAYNEEFSENLLKEYENFKKCMDNNIPPEPMGLACEREELNQVQKDNEYREANDLLPFIEQRMKLDEEIKLKEAEKEKLDAQFKLAIGGHEGLRVGDFIISYKQSKPTTSFDSKRFAIEHQDLYEQYCQEKAGSRRFLVKINQEGTEKERV